MSPKIGAAAAALLAAGVAAAAVASTNETYSVPVVQGLFSPRLAVCNAESEAAAKEEVPAIDLKLKFYAERKRTHLEALVTMVGRAAAKAAEGGDFQPAEDPHPLRAPRRGQGDPGPQDRGPPEPPPALHRRHAPPGRCRPDPRRQAGAPDPRRKDDAQTPVGKQMPTATTI